MTFPGVQIIKSSRYANLEQMPEWRDFRVMATSASSDENYISLVQRFMAFKDVMMDDEGGGAFIFKDVQNKGFISAVGVVTSSVYKTASIMTFWMEDVDDFSIVIKAMIEFCEERGIDRISVELGMEKFFSVKSVQEVEAVFVANDFNVLWKTHQKEDYPDNTFDTLECGLEYTSKNKII